MPFMPKGKILVVDDKEPMRALCSKLLEGEGFEVQTASTGREALDLLMPGNFDLAIVDLVLPDISGLEVLKRTRQVNESIDFIIMTGHASIESAIDCLKNGASDYITKPLHNEEFKILVSRVIEEKRLQEENERLKKLTNIDDLTKLHNIRYMDIVLENEIRRAKRFQSYLSLLFIDIDYFKNINDTYGHIPANKVLYQFGQLLIGLVREVDTVIRYGGDEFIVLLIETNSDDALTIANRIRTAVEEHTFLSEDGFSIKFTSTIGIATYPKPAAGKEELLNLADNAMLKGKKTTRNVVTVA